MSQLIQCSDTVSGLSIHYIDDTKHLVINGFIRNTEILQTIPSIIISIILKYKYFISCFANLKKEILMLTININNKQRIQEIQHVLKHTKKILKARTNWDEEIFIEMSYVHK